MAGVGIVSSPFLIKKKVKQMDTKKEIESKRLSMLMELLMKSNMDNDKFRLEETKEGTVNIIFEDTPEVTKELLTKGEYNSVKSVLDVIIRKG